MYYKILVSILLLDNVLPLPRDNYNIIIIPISKTPSDRTNYHINTKSNRYINSEEEIPHRIDIEHYEEPTEMPDIDSFDYLKDRDDTNAYKKGGGINRNDVIKYLVGRSNDGPKSRYKHDTEYEDNEDPNQRAEDYEMPALYDTDNFGGNKIVGGQEVDINLYPYHVAYGTNCGGAIIDRKWIMTAGHCGKKPYIRVGSKYINQGTKINVKHSYVHPDWLAKKKDHPFDYDFQLLELAENLKFGDNIQPVKIAHIEDMVIGKVVSVTGWGNTKENGPYSTILRAVRVPIISKENCQHVPFPYFRGGLTARMFCAGYSEGKKDACQGDSGGPAVAYDRLLGMVSFGYGCATPGSFGVYSKVAKVRSWIEEVTGLKLD